VCGIFETTTGENGLSAGPVQEFAKQGFHFRRVVVMARPNHAAGLRVLIANGERRTP
jgi:hypothetical protein